MASHVAALPQISDGQRGAVAVIGVIAILALVFAYMLVKEVLEADQGTPKMQEIAKAVQEGAAAYLQPAVPHARRLLGHRLRPAADPAGQPRRRSRIQLGRALFFIVGAVFSALVGFIGMTLATQANVRVAAAARGGGREARLPRRVPHRRHRRHAHRRPRPARRQRRPVHLQRERARPCSRASASAAPCSPCSCVSAAASSPRPPTSAPTWSARSRPASPRTTRATPRRSPTTSATTSATAPAWPPTCSSPTPSRWSPSLILGQTAFGAKGLLLPLLIGAIGIISSIVGILTTKLRDERPQRPRRRSTAASSSPPPSRSSAVAIVAFIFLPSNFKRAATRHRRRRHRQPAP